MIQIQKLLENTLSVQRRLRGETSQEASLIESRPDMGTMTQDEKDAWRQEIDDYTARAIKLEWSKTKVKDGLVRKFRLLPAEAMRIYQKALVSPKLRNAKNDIDDEDPEDMDDISLFN